ncbi:MAG TPA: HDOD domain-containing protein [Bryobacteraceae bacterium]|nr:HDOD domain-containing protein [Bryobacteraceae bacterium]
MPTRTAGGDSCAEHKRRVTAFALELGSSLGFHRRELDLLRDAVEYHEVPAALLQPPGMARLLADITGVDAARAERELSPLRSDLVEIVDAFQRGAGGLETRRYVEVLEMAEALDQQLESEPYAAVTAENPDERDPYSCAAVQNLQRASREELARVAGRLPVFPTAAVRALLTLIRADVDDARIERIAASDPVLAGKLLSTANSARFGARAEIKTLAHAIHYVGTTVARDVLLAAVLKPLFRSRAMKPAWKHSLESAEVAARIAELTGVATRGEALLAGLTHDIGTLAMSVLNPDATARCRRLVAHGCPQRVTEAVVCGADHAEAGEEILRAWKFPPELVLAVRWHHAPERSDDVLSAVLYVTEFWTCSEEDLPSVARLHLAMSRIGLTHAQLEKVPCSRALAEAFPAA